MIEYLRLILWLPILVLSYFFPKDNSVWVFGANGGKQFGDNTKYFYLYVEHEKPSIRPVWISADLEIVEKLQENGYEAYHRNSLEGIFLTLCADMIFITHDLRDVNPWAVGRSTVICFWHGFPLKKISWDGRMEDSPLYQQVIYYLNTRWDRLFTPSEIASQPFETGLKHSKEDMQVTGYPRNDALDRDGISRNIFPSDSVRDKMANTHSQYFTFIYTPTYRDSGENPNETLDWDKINEALVNLGGYIFIKSHPRQPAEIDHELDRISILPSNMDIYPLLCYSDALITDYSSIYFDYLFLNNPVIFYAFDREQYENERGMYFDYDDVTPGPIATNQSELVDILFNVAESDEYAQCRDNIRKKFMTDFELRFSEKAFVTIKSELN